MPPSTSTIHEAARRIAARIAWHFSLAIAFLLVFGTLTFLAWTTYFRVQYGIEAISAQLSHSLRVGDTFQIKTQLLSLSQSGIVDHFSLTEPGGIVIAGDHTREAPEYSLEWIPESSNLTLRFIGGRLHLVRRFELATHANGPGVLTVAKRIHLELFLLLILVPGLLFLFAQRSVQYYILSFAKDLTEPMSELSKALTSARSYDELANISVRDSLRYQELNQTLDAFLELLQHLKSEEDLRRAAERSAALSEIASQVAHDIRSPLTALTVMIKSVNGLSTTDKEIFTAATKRINDIASSLLAKSRAANPPLRSIEESQPVPLKQIVDSVLTEKVFEFSKVPNLKIEKEIEAGTESVVISDPPRMARVISNLFNNAVEALDEQGGTVKVRLALEPAIINLSIEDTGRGIPQQVLERLGNERVTFGKAEGSSGSGLGFLFAKKTLKSFGGDISIQSTLGHGTTVFISLPRASGI